jgi:uncharacterized protein
MPSKSGAEIMKYAVRLALTVTLIPLLSGCPKSADFVELKGTRFAVELATDDATRARGLMFRDALERDSGMLFIFDDSQPRAFWMHNCKISLDILYFDAELKLVSSALSVPPCSLEPSRCPNYASDKPAKYVLELAAGRATELAVSVGDALTLDVHSEKIL